MRYSQDIEILNSVDVLVVGGGPAGIGAAVSAARAGAKVVLIERFGILGGMLTSGQVNPILGSVSAGTIADELLELFQANQSATENRTTRNGRENEIDPEIVKSTLGPFLKRSGVEYYLQCPVVDVIMNTSKIDVVVISTPTGLAGIQATVCIDASGDGTLSFLAGAPYWIGREPDGRCQPTTLEFTISQVDETKAIFCFGGSDPVKLESGEEYRKVCQRAQAAGELPANVSIVRLHKTPHPGERSVNATQANNHDVLSLGGIRDAELELRQQIGLCIGFLRANVPGYEHCMLKSSATALGVRESRRIQGQYVLTDRDVEEGSRFKDVVVHKAWFLIDIHNPSGSGQAEGQSKMARPYDIPYRCLVPLAVDNLLLAGRCISGTHRAHASYRVMTICMAMGQAAGIAAARCSLVGIDPRELDINLLQQELTACAIDLFG